MSKKKSHAKKPRKALHKKLIPLLIIVLIVVVASVFAFVKFYKSESTTKSLELGSEGIVATVNGVPIYQKEIDDLYNRLPAQYKQMITKQALLNQTIARDLLLQVAEKEEVIVEDSEVYSLIDSLLAQSKMTREQLEQQLAQRNITISDMVQEYKKQLTISRLLNKTVYSNIKVTDEEIISFYNNNKELFEQVRASHILMNSSEQAQKILDLIKKGADFNDMAKTYSLDMNSAQGGGDLGYFTRNQMVKEFADASFSLEVGQVSNVVKTEFGYHIIKVTAKKTVPFEEAREQINQALLTQKQTQSVQLYIHQLLSQAYIVIY